MTTFTDIPYRKWGPDRKLGMHKPGQDVFNLAMREHAAGKAVDMQIKVVGPDSPPTRYYPDNPANIYDTISVTIED